MSPLARGQHSMYNVLWFRRGRGWGKKKLKYMDRETLQASFLEKHNSRDKMFIKLQISSKCQSNLKCEDTNNRKGGKSIKRRMNHIKVKIILEDLFHMYIHEKQK